MTCRLALAILAFVAGCTGCTKRDVTTATARCPSWYGPVVEGTRWTYAGASSEKGVNRTFTTTTTLGKVTKSGDTVTFTSVSVTETKATGKVVGTETSTNTSALRCDGKGVTLTAIENVTKGDFANGVSTMTYDGDGYPILPPTLKAGDTWSRQVTGTAVANGQSTRFSMTASAVVKPSGPVTVKAGSFPTVFEVAMTSSTEGGAGTSSAFLVDGVGTVKTSTSALVDKSF